MSNPAPGWEQHPDHIVDIRPYAGTVEVFLGPTLLARSDQALSVEETRHGTVYYLPLTDVEQSCLRDSDTSTYCPFKGHARYWHVTTDDTLVRDALWSYEAPFDECERLKGHVSFYASKVDVRAH